jgi:GcrA cell cycle regulator
MPDTDWTPEMKSELERLFHTGISMSQIAGLLGIKSRNAIIGKVHRMGLVRLSTRVVAPRAPKPPRPDPRPPRHITRITRTNSNSHTMRITEGLVHDEPALRCVEVESRNLTILELEPGDCKYPHGEGSEIRMCGHPAIEGRSYCAPHLALCTAPRRLSDRDYSLSKQAERNAWLEQMGVSA